MLVYNCIHSANYDFWLRHMQCAWPGHVHATMTNNWDSNMLYLYGSNTNYALLVLWWASNPLYWRWQLTRQKTSFNFRERSRYFRTLKTAINPSWTLDLRHPMIILVSSKCGGVFVVRVTVHPNKHHLSRQHGSAILNYHASKPQASRLRATVI